MWDRTNKVLVTVLMVLVIFAALITDAWAQGGGSCTAYYIKYWSYQCQCYITEKRQRCTGWQQPRSKSYGRVHSYYQGSYRRW